MFRRIAPEISLHYVQSTKVCRNIVVQQSVTLQRSAIVKIKQSTYNFFSYFCFDGYNTLVACLNTQKNALKSLKRERTLLNVFLVTVKNCLIVVLNKSNKSNHVEKQMKICKAIEVGKMQTTVLPTWTGQKVEDTFLLEVIGAWIETYLPITAHKNKTSHDILRWDSENITTETLMENYFQDEPTTSFRQSMIWKPWMRVIWLTKRGIVASKTSGKNYRSGNAPTVCAYGFGQFFQKLGSQKFAENI